MAEPTKKDSSSIHETRAQTNFFEPPLCDTEKGNDFVVTPNIENENILTQYDEEQVMDMGRQFARKHTLPNPELFARAAALARRPTEYNLLQVLSNDEKTIVEKENVQPWKAVPSKLWHVVGTISLAAATQGADETVINGALLFYKQALGIAEDSERNSWLEGLVNASPYLFCAIVSPIITDPLNRRFGRKKVIFCACLVSCIACIWQGLTNTWWHLFIARAFLGGFGIGPTSSTVPVFSSECAPAKIRGALSMLWQFFTAVGIALGFVFSLAFYSVPSHDIPRGLNWRLMLGSALIPAMLACIQVPFLPESPRWLMGKGRYSDAYESLRSMRKGDILAARDFFYQYVLLQEEEVEQTLSTKDRLKQLVTVRRNRNAMLASGILTFMQQFCGINVIAYYSSAIFVEADFSQVEALGVSLGFAVIGIVFAIPAFFIIDTKGRRFLLLWTFPFMSMFLLLTGFSFWIPLETNRTGHVGAITLGTYLFTIFYAFGSGVVTFSYTAECFPLYVRTLGTSIMIGNLWFWNFVLAITWPSLLKSFRPQGAFGWYAAWNIVGWCLVLLFVPETKGFTLEELDEVFDVPAWRHARYRIVEAGLCIKKNILWMKNLTIQEPLHRGHRLAVTNPEWNDKAQNKHCE